MIGKLFVINLKALLAGMFMGTRNGKKKPGKGKIVLFTILFIYCAVAFLGLFGLLFMQICGPLFQAGIGWLYFALIAIMAFALCVITSIFTVQALLFDAKDNELLLSMPVKPTSIVLSRILTLLVYEYIFNLLVAAPAIVVWWLTGYATIIGTVFFLLGMLFVPLMSLAVACLVGWGIAALTSRMRNKTLFTLILSFGSIGVYFWLNAKMQSYVAQLISNGEQIAGAMQKSVFPAYHFGLASAEGNLVSLLLFLLCAVLPFALMCAVLIRSFIKIATTKRGAAKIEYKERALRSSGAKLALIKIELKRFFSNAMVLMNAGIGSAFMLAGAAVLIVKPSLITGIAQQLEALAGISPVILCAGIIMMLCSMVTVSSSSISLEGKTLWLVKSLPMSGGDILLAKAMTHVFLSGGPALLASFASIVVLGADPLSALAVILGPLSLSVAMAFFGVIINLIFPKLDWINELQPVKQGISVMICMFSVMGLVIALALVYIFALAPVMSLTIYLLACSVLLLILSGVMYFYLMRGGQRRFLALAK